MITKSGAFCSAAVMVAAVAIGAAQQSTDDRNTPDTFRFKSGIELINVNATVSDSNGRFVAGLSKDDFAVYEDNQLQDVTHFSAERVPVSLGIALDTSGSMAGEKMDDAKSALNRFVYDLLDERDEVFLYRFSDHPMFIQGWTSDRDSISRAIARIMPNGGTALYDAVLEAAPYAATGHNQKKALVLITDGNDTTSINISLEDLMRKAQQSDALIYSISIVSEEEPRAVKKARRALHDLAAASGAMDYYHKDLEDVDRIVPEVAVSSVPRTCSRVDLPTPEAPTTDAISPGWRSKFRPRSTSIRLPL